MADTDLYIPAIVRDVPEADWGQQQRQQVSHVNIELVHQLREQDSAFSTGESTDGVACVKFGMLADEADLVDLVKLVAQRGRELEESSKYMDSLAEMIRSGIEAANDDLRKENEEKLMNEGVMRQLPMVGSLLNWWSPLPNENANMKGRSFNLKTGRMQSTDTIYKHRIQVAHDESSVVPITPVATPQQPHTFSEADAKAESGQQQPETTTENGAPVEPADAAE